MNQFMWHTELQIKVEVIGPGHFPSTSIVKIPAGNQIETDNIHLTSLILGQQNDSTKVR